MGIAVIPMNPSRNGLRKTYPASPSRHFDGRDAFVGDAPPEGRTDVVVATRTPFDWRRPGSADPGRRRDSASDRGLRLGDEVLGGLLRARPAVLHRLRGGDQL